MRKLTVVVCPSLVELKQFKSNNLPRHPIPVLTARQGKVTLSKVGPGRQAAGCSGEVFSRKSGRALREKWQPKGKDETSSTTTQL